MVNEKIKSFFNFLRNASITFIVSAMLLALSGRQKHEKIK